MNNERRDAMMLLAQLLPKPTAEMTETAIKHIEERSQLLLKRFKEIHTDSSAVKQMAEASLILEKYHAGQGGVAVQTVLDVFFTCAFWAAAFNKTMPEAYKLHAEMLREAVK